jgi:SAM-dependent methyltransferase
VSARWPVAQHTHVLNRYRQHEQSLTSKAGTAPGTRRAAEITFFRAIEPDLAEACPRHPVLTNGWIKKRLGELEAATLDATAKQRMQEALASRVSPRAFAGARAGYRAAKSLWSKFLCLPGVRHLYCLQFRRMDPLRGGNLLHTSLVRHYWAEFLEEHRADIRGKALEIGTTATIRKFGGEAVAQADAVDVTPHSPEVNVVADLTRDNAIPDGTYDCFVNQFSMHVIFDVEAALWHSIRILKPGGVLLVNFCCVEYDIPGGLDMGTGIPLYLHWTFTPMQVHNMLQRAGLNREDYELSTFGNLFARIAYQLNMPADHLTAAELSYVDQGHPLLICVRAKKRANWHAEKPVYREPLWTPSEPATVCSPIAGHYGNRFLRKRKKETAP